MKVVDRSQFAQARPLSIARGGAPDPVLEKFATARRQLELVASVRELTRAVHRLAAAVEQLDRAAA